MWTLACMPGIKSNSLLVWWLSDLLEIPPAVEQGVHSDTIAPDIEKPMSRSTVSRSLFFSSTQAHFNVGP